jgi:preprotein translocase subunit SecF
MIRVKDVVSIDEATAKACEAAVATLGSSKLLGFHHPEGGSKIFLEFDGQVDYGAVEKALTGAGCHGKSDRGFGRADQVLVEHALLGIGARLQEQLDEEFGAGTVSGILHSETVGPKVGNQLKVDGVISMIYAIGFIFLYVLLRFDLRFAPGGIVALVHDAFLVVGAFAVTWKEFNLTTIAAILTVIGYSINDTIVIFDRVRERVALYREEDIEATTNTALNDTLSRTILTSGTTLLVVLSTWVFGSGTIRDFAFALLVGIGVGTYSSLFIATPVFLWVNRRFYAGKGHLAWLAEPKPGERPLLAAGPDEVDDETGRPVGDLRAEDAARAEGGDASTGEGGAEGAAPGRLRRRRRSPGVPAGSSGGGEPSAPEA